ncbi:MAG: NACHT domain-containing NTPase [Cyclobacteriaceae bacterium]
MIKELIIKEIGRVVVSLATATLKKVNLKLKSNTLDIISSIDAHLREVKNWSAEISFRDLKSAKITTQTFIELDFFLFPRRIRIDEYEQQQKIALTQVFEIAPKHVVILGQPGAGKTTTAKFFCQSILLNEEFYPDLFSFPILLRLRDYNKPRSISEAGIIVDFVYSTLGLSVDDIDKNPPEVIAKLKEKIVVEVLNKTKALLIIEGFDELVFQKYRESIVSELSSLVNQIERSRIMITSRTADFNLDFENLSCYELCPLNNDQIKQFALKWLGKVDDANNFLQAIEKSPFSDTTIRPLTIAHLCAIYERVGKIPDKPKTVYRKIINLLLEEWDEQRSIKRKSRYANFETDRKFEFLCALAYNLTVSSRRASFSKLELANAYRKICGDFDLKMDESSDVVGELESHTGLFMEAGFELFEFAHKSLQEYLSAEYIVKLPNIIAEKRKLNQLPNELAIGVAISSSPSLYLVELTKIFIKVKLPLRFMQSFINRLLLEKPEFNNQPYLGFYALALYSYYLNSSIESGQLSLFIVDNMVVEFEKLIYEVFKRNPIDQILKQYKLIDSFDSSNGAKILVLEHRSDATIIDEKLPRLLNCRESFLKTPIASY